MSIDLQAIQEKLDAALVRIKCLEDRLSVEQASGERWLYLIPRPHSWRKQLSIKGRNMTVGQLLSAVRANNLTDEEAAEDFDLPVEAVREALVYAAENQALIQLEAAEERRRLAERGVRLEPTSLPG